jgi:hypothetical protein
VPDENVPGIEATSFGVTDVSVSVTFVYSTEIRCSVCPLGQVKSPGPGGPTEMLPLVEPCRTSNAPLLLTGPETVSLFPALGWLPPLLKH